ncbi:hypothetical protein QM012_003805 [Aureobasidium pullulans]|uniref:Zn(2)-C6 fungal-type domain-containing protein n=1 Tax=Aureobasidium pullulans TaxID=5580 RepID=A0ABR0T7Y7_AURPU
MRKPTCIRCQRLKIACTFEEKKFVFVGQESKSRPANSLISSSGNSLVKTGSTLVMDEYFWTNYLPQEDPALDGSIGGILSAPWIPSIRELAGKDDDVKKAMQACALAGLGWMNDDRGLVVRAASFYAQALKQTNTALQDPTTACDDRVLASCRLLILFEMLQRISSEPSPITPQRNQIADWRLHVNGTCRLVQLRGREKHQSGLGVDLYDGTRMTAIIHGLTSRKPNIFTQLDWTVPQSNMRDELYTLINPVPQLLQDFDTFQNNGVGIEHGSVHLQHIDTGVALMQKALNVCYALEGWEIEVLMLCYEKQSFIVSIRSPRSGSAQEQGSLYDVCRLHGYGFFSTCTQYWAMCNIFYSSLRRYHAHLQAFIDTWTLGEVAPVLPKWVSPELHALNIAKVAGYFFEPGMGLWAAHAAVFPVSTALRYFATTGRKDSPAFRSMVDSFTNSKTGVIMRDFLNAIGVVQEFES